MRRIMNEPTRQNAYPAPRASMAMAMRMPMCMCMRTGRGRSVRGARIV